MSDGRAKNGGKRENAGRKSKAEELGLAGLIIAAWPEEMQAEFFSELAKIAKNPRTTQGMEAGKLLLAYLYGKPTERHEQEHNGEVRVTVYYADAPAPASGAADDQG